jgi:hypothetical protein
MVWIQSSLVCSSVEACPGAPLCCGQRPQPEFARRKVVGLGKNRARVIGAEGDGTEAEIDRGEACPHWVGKRFSLPLRIELIESSGLSVAAAGDANGRSLKHAIVCSPTSIVPSSPSSSCPALLLSLVVPSLVSVDRPPFLLHPLVDPSLAVMSGPEQAPSRTLVVRPSPRVRRPECVPSPHSRTRADLASLLGPSTRLRS